MKHAATTNPSKVSLACSYFSYYCMWILPRAARERQAGRDAQEEEEEEADGMGCGPRADSVVDIWPWTKGKASEQESEREPLVYVTD